MQRCGGCKARGRVLSGIVKAPKPQHAPRPTSATMKRLGVVAQHLARDISRSVLRRGR